jgi:hypothetical protein
MRAKIGDIQFSNFYFKNVSTCVPVMKCPVVKDFKRIKKNVCAKTDNRCNDLLQCLLHNHLICSQALYRIHSRRTYCLEAHRYKSN